MTIARPANPGATDGLNNAGQSALMENIVGGLAIDKMNRESYLTRISNTEALKALEQFGESITFRVLKPGTVRAYTTYTDLVPDSSTGVNFSVTVDRAFYSFTTLDIVDMKQINLPLLQKIADRLGEDHLENEYKEVCAALVTAIYGATQMAAYGEQDPARVYYKPNALTVNPAAVSTTRTDANYIIKKFLAARKRANQMGVPKKGRFAMVNSDVEEILLNCDQLTYNVSGQGNKNAIEDGEFGIKIAGYDIIVTDEIPTATVDTATNVAQCLLGHRDGFGFVRQIMETDFNFKMERRFGRGTRQLNVFGFGFNDKRLWGALPLKVA